MTCSLIRRFSAIFYDSLLLGSVLFIATLIILPLIGDSAIEPGNLAYNLFLLIISYLFFCWQWMNGGQTLGMKSWHITLVASDQALLTWRKVSIRFLAAILSWLLLGAGFFWSMFNEQRLSLHDKLSGTRLVLNENK